MDVSAKIFGAVKPKCVALAELTLAEDSMEGSIELLNALKALNATLKGEVSYALKEMNDEQFFIPVNLSDYIMVPLTKLFQNGTLTDSELEYVLSIMHILLKYSWCQTGFLSNELFIQYVTLITFLIGGKPGQFSIKSHSDETFTNGILCLQNLLQGCLNQDSPFTNRALENKNFIPTLGFLVSVLLNISLDSPIAEIKAQSLKTLNLLFHLLDNGEILSLFFPGSVSSIAKIVNSKPHSSVLCEAFTTLTTLVSCIFSDFDLNVKAEYKNGSLESLKSNFGDFERGVDKSSTQENDNLSTTLVVEIPNDKDSRKQHRTTTWLNTTLIQFEKALKIILNIDFKRYDKHSVKDAVFQFDVKVVRNGFLSCYPLIPVILRSLSAISAADSTFLPLIVESLAFTPESGTLEFLLIQLLEDELHHMQYNFSSPDTTKAEMMIQFINFLVQILNEMNGMETSILIKIIKKLQENITLLLEIKNNTSTKKNTSLIPKLEDSMEKRLLLISSHYDRASYYELQETSLFAGIFSKETEASLEKLFQSISSQIDKLVNFDVLLAQEEQVSSNPTGAIRSAVLSWILSSILKKAKVKKSVDSGDFLVFDNDSDPDSTSEIDVSSNDSPLTAKYNLTYSTLEACTLVLNQYSIHSVESFSIASSSIMCLRTINNAIDILNENFEDELIDVLYPIVECLASSSELIRTEAQIVILHLANLLYNGSIEQLLSENADYLVDSLSARLVSESLTPKIPIILSVLVKIGSMDIVAELDDIIRTIFTLLDMYHGYVSLVEGFFLVFDEILSKIYQQLADYDFEELAINLEDENVLTFGMWGLKSMAEVEAFITKYAIAFDDLDNIESEECSSIIEEPLKKSKVLEIDSDDSDDENENENETKSIQSQANGYESNEDDADDNKWLSPIDIKLYNTVTNILSYAERLVQTKSVSLVLLLLKIIERAIPLIATQKTKFLPIGANLWGIVSSTLNETEDLRVVCCSIDILAELIKYGHTFFATRFIELYIRLQKHDIIRSLIEKRISIISKSRARNTNTALIHNQTSTSLNWEVNTFNKICGFFVFALVKLGRYIPIDTAMSIIRITIHYDDDANHYGYFDDLTNFLAKTEC